MSQPSQATKIMGVLNVTPDSFSDAGAFLDVSRAVAHAKQMVLDGADCIDIGGESTRPGSRAVPVEEELRRVIPVITALKDEMQVPISIDTNKPRVAEEALNAGASIINDVTGLESPEMRAIATKLGVPVVVMHMQGKPRTMQENPVYGDVVADIISFFRERITLAQSVGIQDLILDPGIGFGKTLEHNLTILKRLEEFAVLGFPILIGASRKSFIGTLTGGLSAAERLEGTLAASVMAVAHGASWVRVHDVKEHKQALLVVDAIRNI